MERSDVAIIIPAHNEDSMIANIIQDVSVYGIAIVVDDASSDRTAFLAQNAGAVVVTHGYNKGYDGALNTGFKKANDLGCSYAITFDADGQHSSSLLPIYIKNLKAGVGLVLGIRPKTARIAERCYAIYTSLRYGINDPLCGMKGYNMKIYQDRGWFDSYKSIGTELAIYGVRRGIRFVQIQIPISVRNDAPRFGRVLKANLQIFRAMLFDILTIPAKRRFMIMRSEK